MAVSDWDTTAANNGTIGGIDIAENCNPANINNAIRELMSQVALGPLATALGSASLPAFTFRGDPNTGMWSPTADTIAWSTGGSERLRLTSVGDLGFNTSTVTNLGTSIPTFQMKGNSTSRSGGLRFSTSDDSSEGSLVIVDSKLRLLATTNNAMEFFTNNTLRMTLSASGSLSVPDAYNSTTVLAANVYVASTGFFSRSTSSLRFKEVLAPLSDEWAYKLLDLEAIFYKSKCPGDNPDWTHTGFGAEDVAKVNPRWVLWRTTDDDGNPLDEPVADGVHYGQLVTELQHIAKREKARADALEARLSAIEARLAAAGIP